MWPYFIVQALYGQNRVDCILALHKVLRLKFLAGTRREAHTKVWQPLVPGPRDTHLLGTVFRRKGNNRVKIAGGPFGPEKLCGSIERRFIRLAYFEPDLIDPLL